LSRPVERRTFLTGAGALVVAAAACSSSGSRSVATSTTTTTTASTRTTPSTSAPTTSAPRPGQGSFVANGPRVKPQVALTFHTNGDRGLAEALLETVDAARVPITAFVVGSWLEANADFAARIRDSGHELANHTYSHPSFLSLSPAEMSEEITRCRDVLVALSGSGGRWFRPSGTTNGTDDPGATVRELAAAAGYPTVLGFDVDPADYDDPGAAAIEQRTVDALQPGSIVSLHFGHQGTIDALPAILDALAGRGLQPVTVGTLLDA
jgi:peptidoglycan/xylan/chitin deacetylase (PgdA/CDA1 family)